MGSTTDQVEPSLAIRTPAFDQAHPTGVGILDLVFGSGQKGASKTQLRHDQVLATLAVIGMFASIALSAHALIRSDSDALRFLMAIAADIHP